MLHKTVAKVMLAGLLCMGSLLPAHADNKMAPKMAPKMSSKMSSSKAHSSKTATHVEMMSPADKKVEAGMSPAEKALLAKVAHASSMSAGKMRSAMTPSEKRTQTMMSPAEKALLAKMGKASGKKMSGGKKPTKM